MPYPMIKCPSVGEFKDRLLRDYGCEFHSAELIPGDPPVMYFERTVGDKTLRCVVPFDNDEMIVVVWEIRHVCDRLEIPKADFGLILG